MVNPMTETTFQTLKDELNLQDWPDSTSHRETLVTGDLADRIRAKTGRVGEVTIHEDGDEGGYPNTPSSGTTRSSSRSAPRSSGALTGTAK